jgi:hypothetical protein
MKGTCIEVLMEGGADWLVADLVEVRDLRSVNDACARLLACIGFSSVVSMWTSD